MTGPLNKNIEFKKLLLELGLIQKKIAQDSGVGQWYISRFVHGWYPLRDEQQKSILNVLNEHVPPWDPFTVEEVFGASAR